MHGNVKKKKNDGILSRVTTKKRECQMQSGEIDGDLPGRQGTAKKNNVRSGRPRNYQERGNDSLWVIGYGL